MPRIRSIHPDICDDEVLADVSAYAERTFLRLWTHLDDKGRGIDNAKLWKGKLYPLHDDVTSDRVERDLAELTARGLLIRYEVEGKRYLCAKPSAWAKYQRPQHPTPSRLPEPSVDLMSPQAGGVGSGVGEESSRLGEEGESEGEVRAPTRHPQAAGNRLAQRAALHALPGGSGLPDPSGTDRDAPASPLPPSHANHQGATNGTGAA